MVWAAGFAPSTTEWNLWLVQIRFSSGFLRMWFSSWGYSGWFSPKFCHRKVFYHSVADKWWHPNSICLPSLYTFAARQALEPCREGFPGPSRGQSPCCTSQRSQDQQFLRRRHLDSMRQAGGSQVSYLYEWSTTDANSWDPASLDR